MSTPVPWREAWEAALYRPWGFYRHSAGPSAHFRTSVHASPLFAGAILRLARSAGLDTVVDVGAGGGELLRELSRLDPGLRLCGVDLGARPTDLPDRTSWTETVPEVDGVLLANEWLDNVACDVVEVTADGPRVVLVDPATGMESVGPPPAPADREWLDRWWPLTQPGQRAEVGRSRDDAWAAAVGRLGRGLAVAVDYFHSVGARPYDGTLTGYRHGRQVDPVPDGSCDITAHVALDACAAAVQGAHLLVPQRAALRALGVHGGRPPRALASSDAPAYLAALTAAGEAAELTDAGGLGGFGWLVHAVGVPLPDLV
ncbi:MAG: SAM-dependent methyltransferase [Pseudonocardiales bacterium]